jgi:hypothetical protein
VGIIATVICGLFLNALLESPPLADELAREREQAAGDGWLVRKTLKSDLQGIGRPVYALVLQDRRLRTNALRARSDELRIFTSDTSDGQTGTIDLAFEHQPRHDSPNSPALIFDARYNEDLDENGTTELIGAYHGFFVSGPHLPVPVVLDWNDRNGEFRLTPLLRDPPRLAAPRGGGGWITHVRALSVRSWSLPFWSMRPSMRIPG